MVKTILSPQQEEKIINLLWLIDEQSSLFFNSEPLVLTIPFETLNKIDISFAEARKLIFFLNEKVGIINPETIWINILNGTVAKSLGQIVSQTEEDTNPISGVDLEDDKDSLILEIYNLVSYKKKVESLLNINISKSGLKSYFEDGEIIVGRSRLKIYKNSEQNDFCEIIFSKPPRSDISFLEIWSKVKNFKDEAEKLNQKEQKSIENMASVLNSKLKKKGVKQKLFSIRRPVVYRNY